VTLKEQADYTIASWNIGIGLVRAIAWPVVALILLLVYKRVVSGLVGRLLGWKGFGMEASFAKEVVQSAFYPALRSSYWTVNRLRGNQPRLLLTDNPAAAVKTLDPKFAHFLVEIADQTMTMDEFLQKLVSNLQLMPGSSPLLQWANAGGYLKGVAAATTSIATVTAQ